MNIHHCKRGAAPVGLISDLPELEATCVLCLRQWCDGPDGQATLWRDMIHRLGTPDAKRAMQSFEQLFTLCAAHGRRKLMRHSVECDCLGADEACFANFISSATEGHREDAMLIATLLVRADFAPLVTTLAMDFGLLLSRQPSFSTRQGAGAMQFSTSTIH